jgi:hypothetical protein
MKGKCVQNAISLFIGLLTTIMAIYAIDSKHLQLLFSFFFLFSPIIDQKFLCVPGRKHSYSFQTSFLSDRGGQIILSFTQHQISGFLGL